MRLMNNGAYISGLTQNRQENSHMKLVTIIGVFKLTILYNRGFAGDYLLKKGTKKIQNAEVGLATDGIVGLIPDWAGRIF